MLRKDVLAEVTEPAGLALFSHDPYELAHIAVEQAAKKTLAALYDKGGPAYRSAIIEKPDRGAGFRYQDGSRASTCTPGMRPNAVGICR